jgi:hypothetical protein
MRLHSWNEGPKKQGYKKKKEKEKEILLKTIFE